MKTWRVEDFITYLYQIAADADLITDEDEILSVKSKVVTLLSNYFPGIVYSYEESLDIIRNTPDVNLFTTAHVVKELSQKFHFSDDLKTDIVSDLNDVVRSDEKVTSGEHETVNHIRALLKRK
jgi:hypothetical protein